MITQEKIEEVKKRLVKVYDPLEIYLFGSYAWGTPTEDSDLDLLIVVEESNEKSYKRSMPGDRALYDLPISWDLIIYTKNEFLGRAADRSSLCYKIGKVGKVLYAKS